MATKQVTYIDVDQETGYFSEKTVTATVIDANTDTLTSGWYVVESDVTRTSTATEDKGIVIEGDVKIILADGCTYNIDQTAYANATHAAVAVENGDTLTIYGQTGGTGKLSVHGPVSKGSTSNADVAAIGGGTGTAVGKITIVGGQVTANNGYAKTGAGIGGAAGAKVDAGITIWGGTVQAMGADGSAGIGSAKDGDASNITINGGNIIAIAGVDAAGIGGGLNGALTNFTVNGGVVSALTPQGGSGAGIGSGRNGKSKTDNLNFNGGYVMALGGFSSGAYGAGIGVGANGGDATTCGTVTITGGKIEATSIQSGSYYASSIGGGDGGSGKDITKADAIHVSEDVEVEVKIDGELVKHSSDDNLNGPFNLSAESVLTSQHRKISGSTELVGDFTRDGSFFGSGGYADLKSDADVTGFDVTFKDFTANNSCASGGVFEVSLGATLNLTGAAFTGNKALGNVTGAEGGAICNFGEVTLTNATFTDNFATCSQGVCLGGAIVNNNALNLSGVTFENNRATTAGGAIYNKENGTVTLTGAVTLKTATDTIVNVGTLNWDLTGADSQGSISDWTRLTNESGSYLDITIDSSKLVLDDQKSAYTYTLAKNAASSTDTTFFIHDGVKASKDITVGESIEAEAGKTYYQLKATNGNLNFTYGDIKTITVTGTTVADKMYDGTTAGTITLGTVSGIDAGDDVRVTITSNLSELFASKDVGTYNVTVTYALVGNDAAKYKLANNGEDTIEDIEITQRNIKLTSASDSKTYDGTELTNSKITVTGDGFVGDEGFETLETIGSQTDVGMSENTINYKLNASALGENEGGNYYITKEEGTLEVKKIKATYTILPKGGEETRVYDGSTLKDATEAIWTGLREGDTLTYVLKDEDKVAHVGSNQLEPTSVTIKDAQGKDVPADAYDLTRIKSSITVTKRDITLTSNSETKVYDGKAVAASVTVTGGSYATKDKKDECFTYSFKQKSFTKVGTYENSFTVSDDKATDTYTSDYNYTLVAGTVTITQAEAITITANSDTKKYDGTALTLPSEEGKGYTYTGKLAEGDKLVVTIEGTITDAGTAASKVSSYKIVNADGDDVTNCYKAAKLVDGTLTVTKRQVTLTSDTASKQYDGTPLTNSKVIVSGDEFVDGEGASYDVTGSQTIPGTSANTFTYELNENTKADNYNITTVTGSLVVTQRDAITITAASKSKMYDGEALTLTNSDYTITSGSLADCDELSVTIEGTITDAGTVVSKVTSYKIIDKKTGEDHTGYYAKANLVEGTLTVTKRDVTLTSNDATKKYDGTALTDDGVTASGSGFIQGQGFTYEVSGSQTAVGSSANTFTYKLTDGTKASNYNITTEYGTLNVTQNDTLITITAGSATKEYDGTALTYTEGFTVDGKLAEGDEVVSVSTAASAVVHVSDGTGINEITGWVIKNKAGQDVTEFYSNVQTQTGTLKINPRKVYMTSADAIKVYDETALTADDMIFSNWLPGDTATYSKITGSQTTIGQSDNTWDMDSVKLILGSGAEEGDYDITTGMGLLTVIPGDPLKVDKNSVAGTALQLPCDMTVESTTITDAKALKLKDEATLTTDKLTLAGGALDATDGTAKIGAIVAESGNNIVTGDVEALTEDGAITIDVARYADLTIDWDLFDQAFYGWQSITAKKDCWLYVTSEEEITLVQDDLMAFDKSGRFAHLVFADQDVVDVNNLKLTSGDYLDIHFQNGYGTEKADTITAAAGAYVRLTASGEGGLDLAEGKNKVMIGSSATLGLFGKLVNATTINVAAGKEDDLTDAMFDVVEGTQTLKAGNFTWVTVSGLFTGTERADSIVIGNKAKFETFKTMNLGDGNDKLTVGKNSEFTANGINCGEGNDTLSIGKGSMLSLAGVVDFGNGNDKLEIGAGAKAYAYDALSFGSGNDTLTLGADAYLEAQSVTFGTGSDKLTIGKGATLAAQSIIFDLSSSGSGKDALTVGAGAEVSVADAFTGSLNKLTIASGTEKDGKTTLKVKDGYLTGTGKADTFLFGTDVVADFGTTNVYLGAGNDTFKVGNDSQVSLGNLDFGAGKDTLTIGKNSTVSVNKLDNLEKLTIGTGSTLVITNVDSYNAAIAKWGEKYSGQIVCP